MVTFMEKAIEKSPVAAGEGKACSPEELVPGMVKLLWAMKVDRPSAWSPAFEGLSPVDLHILAFVDARPDVILKDIRDYLDVPGSTLTGLVDRLEKRGLIKRTISGRDRRSYGLRLTRKGGALREEQQQIRLQGAEKMLKALDSYEERLAFVDMMNKIGERLARAAAVEGNSPGGD
jgi:DNA-binding MarR family transcriptional regulator